jgi:hypothetical protein
MLITADCLHTQRKHARYLHGRDADFVFCVKDNQPGLFAALDVLPWPDTPITHRMTDRGQGRLETRTLQAMPAPPDLPFPHVEQVFLVERAVTTMTGKPVSNVAILGVTSMNADRGTPETIAQAVRGLLRRRAFQAVRHAVLSGGGRRTGVRSAASVLPRRADSGKDPARLHPSVGARGGVRLEDLWEGLLELQSQPLPHDSDRVDRTRACASSRSRSPVVSVITTSHLSLSPSSPTAYPPTVVRLVRNISRL